MVLLCKYVLCALIPSKTSFTETPIRLECPVVASRGRLVSTKEEFAEHTDSINTSVVTVFNHLAIAFTHVIKCL